MKLQNLEVQELSTKEKMEIDGGRPNYFLLAISPVLYGGAYLIGRYL